MDYFKILSMDGGGIRGAFTASFLRELQNMIDAPLYSYFDLIVGTSTGGIIALGLALGIPIETIFELYRTEGEIIFGKKKKRFPAFRNKHDFTHLCSLLQDIFSNKKIENAHTRLLIPSFDLTTGKVKIYKTPHHKDFFVDYKKEAWEVALATASAPIYAPSFLDKNGYNLIDGGIWANNPTLIGLIEAIYKLGSDPKNIQMLSIGTGRTEFCHNNKHPLKWGFVQWTFSRKKGIIHLMLDTQNQATQNIVKYFQLDYYRRIDFIMDKNYPLDDYRYTKKYITFGIQRAQEFGQEIKTKFFEKLIEPYKPISPIGAKQ